MIVFTHIPRTGGTSLRRFIVDNLPEGASHAFIDSFAHFAFLSDSDIAGFDFLATHCGYGLFNRVRRPHTRVIVLRDPVERVVSLYHHLRTRPDGVSYASSFAKSMTLESFVSCDNPAVSVFVQDTQTWQLVADKNQWFRHRYRDLLSDEVTELAVEHLKSFDFVGITSELGALCTDIAARFEWPRPESPPHLNKGPGAGDTASIARSTIDLIQSRVRLDSALYETARKTASGSACSSVGNCA